MVDEILKYSEKVSIWPEVIREPGKIRPISIDNMHSQLQVTLQWSDLLGKNQCFVLWP